MQYYNYNGNGSGCNTWCRRLVELMVERGYLPVGTVESFDEIVVKVRLEGRYWVADEEGASWTAPFYKLD